MKKIFGGMIVAACLLLAIHLSFSRRTYNVILITIDTLRADHVSCYNPHAQPTPNIDRIADHGTLFTNAVSLIPVTLPAHTSILTSRRPHEELLFDNGQFLQLNTPTISEVLAKEKYQTAAFVSLGVLKRVFGLNRGFDTYDDDFAKYHRYYRFASEMNEAAIPWITAHSRKQFFAWIHYSDPHEPYVPADSSPDTELKVNGKTLVRVCLAKQEVNQAQFEARPGETILEFRSLTNAHPRTFFDRIELSPPDQGLQMKFGKLWGNYRPAIGEIGRSFKNPHARIVVSNPQNISVSASLTFVGRDNPSLSTIRENYTAEVRYVDRHIGILWDKLGELGIRDHTIVVLTADHGESLGEHHRIGHLFPLWSQIMEVPLIVYYPGLGWKGRRVNRMVDHLDIAPTILDLLHKNIPGVMEGRSLKQFISWSPFDWLMAKDINRTRTFMYTFAPQGKANTYAVREGSLKVIERRAAGQWNWEEYDLESDPLETKNLAASDPQKFNSAEAASLRKILQAYSSEAEMAYGRRLNPALKEEDKNMLRSLGYVSP